MLILIFVVTVILYVCKSLWDAMNYWKYRNIPYRLPFKDNIDLFIWQKPLNDIVDAQYKEYPNRRYYGLFQMASPMLMIKDLDLIKAITIKDFDHFTNHRTTENVDPLMSKNLMSLKGQEWKDMRSLLSPAFTGSKMRAMFPLMADCAQKLTEFFGKKSGNLHEVEMKDVFTRYTNDVIATCAFGFTCDSLENPENEFYVNGREAMNFGGLRALVFFLALSGFRFFKLLRLRIIPKNITEFFIRIIKQTIKYRQDNDLIRPDMIHLLLEAQKEQRQNSKEEMTEEDIAAQGFIFFLAGFETASVLLSFVSTELAIHPDVQEKLLREVDETMESCQGKLTYDAVMRMKYLDMVLMETLRKWPPAAITDRVCNKSYTIPAAEGEDKDFVLNEGDVVAIPIWGIHRDERYYPNSDRFDPERFSEENKRHLNPDTYMPFGIGPRNCIGSRFALLENKILFAYLLKEFEFVPVSKTSIPLKITMKNFKLQPKDGFWLGLQKRNK